MATIHHPEEKVINIVINSTFRSITLSKLKKNCPRNIFQYIDYKYFKNPKISRVCMAPPNLLIVRSLTPLHIFFSHVPHFSYGNTTAASHPPFRHPTLHHPHHSPNHPKPTPQKQKSHPEKRKNNNPKPHQSNLSIFIFSITICANLFSKFNGSI